MFPQVPVEESLKIYRSYQYDYFDDLVTLFPGMKDRQLDMVSDYETIFPVWDTCSLAVGKGRKVSIISPDNTLKIKSYGLEYSTENVIFDNWWKATLNKAAEDEIKLEFSHPSAAVIFLD